MGIQTIKVGRQKFIILAAKDFCDLQRRASVRKGKPSRRSDARDRADAELAAKRLTDPNERPVPCEAVRKKLGLQARNRRDVCRGL